MLTYLARRIGQALLVLVAAYTVSFFILFALPGDAVTLIAGGDASNLTEEQLADLRREYGIDQPLWVQYFTRLGALLTGDFGRSFSSGRPVAEILGEAIWPTAQIAGLGLIIAIVFGAGIAILANYTRLTWLGDLLVSLPPLGVAIPGFWFGLMLLEWFSFGLPIFPAVGDKGPLSLVLPAITLALPTGATIAQLLSKSLAATLREPYVDTAWAKGASRARVHFGHALKNAALPALTMTGLIVGQLLSGAVVTETVFSRPGLGRVTASAVTAQDIPLVLGVVVIAATVFVVANLLVDIIYPLLDPRIVQAPRKSRIRAAELPAGQADESAAAAPAQAQAQGGNRA